MVREEIRKGIERYLKVKYAKKIEDAEEFEIFNAVSLTIMEEIIDKWNDTKELYENGINVCFAQDSIQDPWYPAGNGNLMNVLDNGIHIAQMMSFEEMDNCLDLITVNGAKTMNISDIYGIEAGKPANFIVVDARSEFEAVCERADVVASVRNGEYLFKKAPVVFEALSEFMA